MDFIHTCMYVYLTGKSEEQKTYFLRPLYEVYLLIENTAWGISRQNVDRFVNSQRKGQLLLVFSEENICIK